jgi:PIN domain nuclease of toxin-antitoxin system
MTRGYLLDTHALLWATLDPDKLGADAHEVLRDQSKPTYASSISAMEIATKYRLGKLPEGEPWARDFVGEIAKDGFLGLALTAEHGQRGGNLPFAHKDPFDRLLIAQAQIEQLTLISNETLFDSMAVIRLW